MPYKDENGIWRNNDGTPINSNVAKAENTEEEKQQPQQMAAPEDDDDLEKMLKYGVIAGKALL